MKNQSFPFGFHVASQNLAILQKLRVRDLSPDAWLACPQAKQCQVLAFNVDIRPMRCPHFHLLSSASDLTPFHCSFEVLSRIS